MTAPNRKDEPHLPSFEQPEEAPHQEVLQADLIETEEADVTGGDLDNNLYQAEVVGEEAVGGQTPTPDQNVTEELLHAMGIDSVDGEAVRTKKKLEWRDNHRWELEPESSEDYQKDR